MRAAAARARLGSVPAAISAAPQAWLLPVCRALPSADMANSIGSGFGWSGSVRCRLEPEESHFEADAGCAGTVGFPVTGVVEGVGDGEPGLAASIVSHANVHPTDVAAELPGNGVVRGRFTGRDRAAGVAFQLKAAAEFEVAGDGQKPVGDSLGVGCGIPQVLDRGCVAAGESDRMGRLSVALECRDRTIDGAQVFFDVELHGVLSAWLTGLLNAKSLQRKHDAPWVAGRPTDPVAGSCFQYSRFQPSASRYLANR